MGGTEGVKGILSTVLCVVLALALVVFAVGSGDVRGWRLTHSTGALLS